MKSVPSKLTPNQQAIWLESKLHVNKPIFNIGTYVQLNGIPDGILLEKAIKLVIAQNDALRLRIGTESTQPEQFFDAQRDFRLESCAFNSIEKATEWMNADFTEAIEIDQIPLYQIRLVTAESRSFLYFKYHHIFIDGWSRAQLVQKIANQYNGLLSNTNTDISSSYKSYVESSERTEEELQESLDFWKTAYDDFDRVSIFQKKDPKLRFAASKRKRLSYSKESFDSIALNGNTDLKAKFYFLLASLYVTLSRATGTNEFVIGIPLLNRFNEKERSTIGYFVGLIPLRLKFASDTPFSKIVSGIQKKMKSTIPYRKAAIHEINKSAGVNFSNSTQLFDVVFSFEPHNHDCHFGDAKVIHSGTFSSDFEQNPLVIHVQNFNDHDTINFEFDYNLNYLDDLEVDRLMERYSSIIEQYKIAPHATNSSVNSLLDDEASLLKEYSVGQIGDPLDLSLIEQIEATAKKYPDRKILHDNKTSITYAALMNRAKQIAGNLLSLGIKQGESVGILAPRNINTVVSVVGVLMSGARYVPIDPEIPEERLNYMAEIAMIKALLYDSSVSQPPNLGGVENIDLIQLSDVRNFELSKIPKDNPAYVIFTSGTTGKPKGVCINQNSVSNLVQFLKEHVYDAYGEHLRLAHIASFNFDQSAQHMFASLVLGHELVIVSENARKDGKLLLDYLTRFKIDVCDGIPTQLSAMLTMAPSMPDDFNVKHFIIGGEAFTPELARQLFSWSKGRNIQVTNAYGPTESTVFSMHYTFNAENYSRYPDIPIGKPIRNTTIWILDENGRLLPPGSKGELCIGGVGLATEYVNRDDLTKNKFKFNKDVSERLYHTGDVAQWNAEGELRYFGRSDSQVKVKGYRIELSEIEHWLNEIDGVEQAVVLVKKNQSVNHIIGFVQSKTLTDSDVIRKELIQHLPEYMVPQVLVIMATMPLTKTGKFDRKKLLSQAENIEHHITNTPNTELEAKLAKIMASILDVDQIDTFDSFFSQGGDSLSLVFFLAEIEKQLNVSLSMTEFATMNSVQAIARMIETERVNDRELIDLEKEITIVEELGDIPTPHIQHSDNVALLTGATGFVGAFVLKELLECYDQVFCLVRANNETEAANRMWDALEQYELTDATDRSKISILKGNLGETQLGLSDSDYQRVVSEVDTIYHCAAMVNFIKDFEVMKKVNVGSTLELLKVCKKEKSKQFNYISTMGVFSAKDTTFPENSTIEDQLHYQDRGYESTKWIAENIIQKARDYGIDSNVFRLGRITGDSQQGAARYEDFFHRFIEGCLRLELFPFEMFDLETDLTPVDTTARSIVALSAKAANEVFHIVNEKKASYAMMLKIFENQGVRLNYVTYETWIKAVDLLNASDNTNPLFLITPLLKQKSWFSVYQNVLDNKQTTKKMTQKGIEWPEGNDLWSIYIQKCIRRSAPNLQTINNSNIE